MALASIIVTCKGRLQHLVQTLPFLVTACRNDLADIIVVDYGCPQHTFEHLAQASQHGVTAIRIEDDVAVFNLARARNCGAQIAQSQTLAFMDADVVPPSGWLPKVINLVASNTVSLVQPFGSVCGKWDRTGTCAVSAGLFHAVRGYDERLLGWGPEDWDFYERCALHGAVAFYAPTELHTISHSDVERTQHYAITNLQASSRLQLEYIRSRQGRINPDGYGLGQFSIHRGTRDYFRSQVSTPPPARVRHLRRYRQSK